jgi:hypothetical protein
MDASHPFQLPVESLKLTEFSGVLFVKPQPSNSTASVHSSIRIPKQYYPPDNTASAGEERRRSAGLPCARKQARRGYQRGGITNRLNQEIVQLVPPDMQKGFELTSSKPKYHRCDKNPTPHPALLPLSAPVTTGTDQTPEISSCIIYTTKTSNAEALDKRTEGSMQGAHQRTILSNPPRLPSTHAQLQHPGESCNRLTK